MITVDLVQHPSVWPWLAPLLTLFGSLILFVGSLIVVWRTNVAADNRAARARQNELDRDFRLWQRDTLLPLGDHIVQAAIDAHSNYLKIRHAQSPIMLEDFDVIDEASLVIASNISRLRLIGAHETAERCVELRDSIDSNELVEGMLELDHLERAIAGSQPGELDSEGQARRRVLESQFDSLLEHINVARVAFGQAVEKEIARTNAAPSG